LLTGLALIIPTFLAVGIFNSLAMLVVVCVIIAITYTLINIPINVLIMSATDPEYQARVLNLTAFFVGISMPLTLLFYGALLEVILVADLFIAMAVIVFLSIPLLWRNRLLNKTMKIKLEDIPKWCSRLYRC
jgi:MFS family permease